MIKPKPTDSAILVHGPALLTLCRGRSDIESVSVGPTPAAWLVRFRPAKRKELVQADLLAVEQANRGHDTLGMVCGLERSPARSPGKTGKGPVQALFVGLE